MKNKRLTRLMTILILIIVGFCFCLAPAFAQSKVIKKNVTKVIIPEIQKEDSEESDPEATPTLSPPPPPSQINEAETTTTKKGLLGWNKNADLTGLYLISSRNQQGLLGLIGGKLNMVFEDPLKLGAKMGLAEDAVEYNLGLGLLLGNDANNLGIVSIPLSFGGKLYLKESSLFGTDPYLGLGANYNLLGTGQAVGGALGFQLYAGTLIDWGFEGGKTGISIGYNAFKVTDLRAAEGFFISISQPFKL